MNAALVLVATPIGNLGDLSPRAVNELGSAALVCCEDTRRSGQMFKHLGIRAQALRRVDAHTETTAIADVVSLLDDGHRVALVTDAGSPGICDPAQRLVGAVVAAGHKLEVVPGPSALIAALMGSGFVADRFVFEGFLPRRGATRLHHLEQLAHEQRTSVLFESPKRIAATLAELVHHCGPQRQAVIARELTKLHEEFVRGSLDELVEWATTEPKGEIVLVLKGADLAPEVADETILEALRGARKRGLSSRDAAALVAADLGVAKRRAYELWHHGAAQ